MTAWDVKKLPGRKQKLKDLQSFIPNFSTITTNSIGVKKIILLFVIKIVIYIIEA